MPSSYIQQKIIQWNTCGSSTTPSTIRSLTIKSQVDCDWSPFQINTKTHRTSFQFNIKINGQEPSLSLSLAVTWKVKTMNKLFLLPISANRKHERNQHQHTFSLCRFLSTYIDLNESPWIVKCNEDERKKGETKKEKREYNNEKKREKKVTGR